MQEGAGVRQMIEDELRRVGTRLRDLDVRLELGLQESVTSAVRAGYGVTFISRTSVESDLAAGTLAEARVEGLELEREIYLVRASGRAETRAARAFVEFAARRELRVIVRWSLAELPGVLAELGIERPLLVASPRWDAVDAAGAGRWSEIPSDRIEVPPAPTALLAVGGGSAIDTAQGRLGGDRPAGRVGADDVLGRRVDDRASACATRDRRIVGGGGGAHLAAIVYDVDLTLDLPRAETVGTALNALAHCAEALYVRGATTRATTRVRSRAPS